jgi:hypothetical protein
MLIRRPTVWLRRDLKTWETSLETAPVEFPDEVTYRAFVETVVFRLHLAALPAALRPAFSRRGDPTRHENGRRFHTRLCAAESQRPQSPACEMSAVNLRG